MNSLDSANLEFLLAHGGKARQESKIVGRHSDRRGLKNEGHMPEDKYLLMSRKGKRLGVAFASSPRGEGGAGSLKFKTK
jgi:hypothetical protein